MNEKIPNLDPDAFQYELPLDRIATRPAGHREESRLLVVRRGEGVVRDDRFANIVEILPPASLLVLNTTRVVKARLVFTRPSGGRIEVMLLEPIAPSHDPAVALAATGATRWRAMIGGARKARRDGHATMQLVHDGRPTTLTAEFHPEAGAEWDVDFGWSDPHATFGDILGAAGSVPIPPYLNRPPDESDSASYQTVYAASDGAVAAPTAGLHFTETLLADAVRAGSEILRVDLHVGAGTFRPISDRVENHKMHRERIAVPLETIVRLTSNVRGGDAKRPIITVGTTSMRAIESLYWFGVRLLRGEGGDDELLVKQWDPYRQDDSVEQPIVAEALDCVIQHLTERDEVVLTGATELMIVPGYHFKLCDGMITNFHQPASTLILLVAAFMGVEHWRAVYQHALDTGYRFLSYGDASIILPSLKTRESA